MTEQELEKIKRKSAREWLISIPLGHGVDERQEVAIECAMNEEWWRGFHAGKRHNNIN